MAYKDTYGWGMLIGLLWALAAWGSWIGYAWLRPALGPLADKLHPPAFQLFLLGLALLLFRFMMIRWKLVRTGKGMLAVLFGMTLLAYLHSRFDLF